MISKSSNPIFSAIVIAGLIIAGAIVYSNRDLSVSEKNVLKGSAADLSGGQESAADGHAQGNPEAKIVIVEYSDFECPYCAKFNQTMNQLMENYGSKVKWVYKHFPLSSHSEARPAAEASECAAEQGKFWEFHDGLFASQPRLGESLYAELAEGLKLDLEQFEECVSLRKYKDKVSDEYDEGLAKGVEGTPGNFINNFPIGGAVPYEQLKSMVDSLLDK